MDHISKVTKNKKQSKIYFKHKSEQESQPNRIMDQEL